MPCVAPLQHVGGRQGLICPSPVASGAGRLTRARYENDANGETARCGAWFALSSSSRATAGCNVVCDGVTA